MVGLKNSVGIDVKWIKKVAKLVNYIMKLKNIKKEIKRYLYSLTSRLNKLGDCYYESIFNFFGSEAEVKIEPIQDKLLLLLNCFYIKLSVKYLEDNSKIDINEIQHNSGIYTIYLRDSFSEHKKLMKLLIDCHQVVRDLCDSKGIADNETEAYLYGYIMGECFVSLLNKKKLFENVPKEKYIEFLCKSSKIRCIIKSQVTGISEPGQPRYTLSKDCDGSVQYRNKSNIYVLLRPYKYNWSRKMDIFFHEFYHLHRLLFKYYNDELDKYIFIQDLMNKTLPILNYYYNGK